MHGYPCPSVYAGDSQEVFQTQAASSEWTAGWTGPETSPSEITLGPWTGRLCNLWSGGWLYLHSFRIVCSGASAATRHVKHCKLYHASPELIRIDRAPIRVCLAH